MRFSLRTLMIIVVVFPPAVALVWWDMVRTDNSVPMSVIMIVLVIFAVVTAMIGGQPRDWR